MDSQQAKEILTLYRPGTTDAADPRMAKALELVKTDPELAAWFEQQCAVYTALRDKFKGIPIPRDLKRKIITERPPEPRIVQLPGLARWLAAAAAVMVIGGILWTVLTAARENTYTVFKDRMITKIARGYFMDAQLTNQTDIREYFRTKNAAVDYQLTKGLQELPGDGCALFAFNNHPIELLCLYDNVGPNAVKNPVWVFVMKKNSLPDAPKASSPEIVQVEGFATASWASGDSAYFLVSRGEKKDIAKYLE